MRWSACCRRFENALARRGWPQKAASTRISESEFGNKCYSGPHSREELRDGYVQLMQELYEPTAYFDRLDDLFVRATFASAKLGQRTGGGIRGLV